METEDRRTAKKLLGWLLCARRPLKWHEIQGGMSFDYNTNTFNYAGRHLLRDIKHFCGSIVDIHKGGAIELVHMTAKL
jgi:hypothetical protein